VLVAVVAGRTSLEAQEVREVLVAAGQALRTEQLMVLLEV
jgi:hypothetical protein